MTRRNGHNRSGRPHLGWFAGLILRLFGKKPKKLTSEQLFKKDFRTATGRMGFHFSDRIRDVFRFRWLKPK